MTPDEQFVRQQIPIDLQGAKPAVIEIRSLSGNGWNEVGIRTSQENWNALTSGAAGVTVRLISSTEDGTQIEQGAIDRKGLWPIESFHYIFNIDGKYGAKALVEMIFPNAPIGPTRVEILVLKTPADTGS
jgi:hypothetical protein